MLVTKTIAGSVALAAAGAGLLGACTNQAPGATTTTTTAPRPADGCYSGDSRADLKIVGRVNTANGVEVYDAGSNCTTTVNLGPWALYYVQAADQNAALAACQAVDTTTHSAVDLSTWNTPSPGLAGFWACSPK